MIYARPHLNGNTPEQFRHHGRCINEAANVLRYRLNEAYSDVFHGRNYQHNPDPGLTSADPRDIDVAKLTMALQDLDKIQQLAIDIFKAGEEA